MLSLLVSPCTLGNNRKIPYQENRMKSDLASYSFELQWCTCVQIGLNRHGRESSDALCPRCQQTRSVLASATFLTSLNTPIHMMCTSAAHVVMLHRWHNKLAAVSPFHFHQIRPLISASFFVHPALPDISMCNSTRS